MTVKNKVIVFDLDDTLYKERDFLISGYKEIVRQVKSDFDLKLNFNVLYESFQKGENVFKNILGKYDIENLNMDYLITNYRFHTPRIKLKQKVKDRLESLKSDGYNLGLLTDGRSITQRNKLEALDLEEFFDEVIISEEFGSEKPNLKNYRHFEKKFGNAIYYYIGDNLRKDFISPNILNWNTIGVRDIENVNIHEQNLSLHENEFLPGKWINSISELEVHE